MNDTDTQLRQAAQALVDACYDIGVIHTHVEGEWLARVRHEHSYGVDVICREHGHSPKCPVAELEATLKETP